MFYLTIRFLKDLIISIKKTNKMEKQMELSRRISKAF
jgi:hypothetical protein